MAHEPERENEEIIISELQGDENAEPGSTRTIRVYDRVRGDFLLDVPRQSTITFGYFNPGTPRFDTRNGYGDRRPSDIAAATAMRIYEKGPKSSQLACFLDVHGFRDLSLKLTRLKQRVTVESNFEDDGDGDITSLIKRHRELNPANEDDGIPF